MFSREELIHQLKTEHWDSAGNWDFIEENIENVTRLLRCDVEMLQEIMREIEGQFPDPEKEKKKPQTWRQVEFRKPCRTCGVVIGFARTDAGNLMPVNLHDFTNHWNCEKPGKPKKKKKG